MIVPNRFKAFTDFELACIFDPIQLFMEEGKFPDKGLDEQQQKLWLELKEEMDARQAKGFDLQAIYDKYEM